MFYCTIPASEYYDEATGEFVATKGETLQLEHSLVSISKWEAKWKKPFLVDNEKSTEEQIDYIRCMTINHVDPIVYNFLTASMFRDIFTYINDPMTATTINDQRKNHGKKEIITSELIYYWMISLEIPVEFQKWHLNRLLTLIRVCSLKNDPKKTMPKKDALAQNYALNAQRRAKMKSRG